MPSIGIEIEIENSIFYQDIINKTKLFQDVDEHCGRELRSKPASGPTQIRRLFDAIRMMEERQPDPGFHNTGTHLHIDFADRASTLKRKQARLDSGLWMNPFGNGKRYYWVDESGMNWESPSAAAPNIAKLTNNTPADLLLAIKRFLVLGIRFADVLLAIQHPHRRFNKYCHTLAYWDEAKLMACKSVKEIIHHPNLVQNHRRHAINVMSFPKHGTMEIRIMRGTLDTEEIWAQTFLFCRMARLAKNLDAPIPAFGNPKSKTELGAGLVLLLNACGIHGKMRRYLIELSKTRLDNPSLECFCFYCHEQFRSDDVKDFGLSRAVCPDCFNKRCIFCSLPGSKKVDDKLDGGRWLCVNHDSEEVRKIIATREKVDGIFMTSEGFVGAGFDSSGLFNLSRVQKLFCSKRRSRVVKTLKVPF